MFVDHNIYHTNLILRKNTESGKCSIKDSMVFEKYTLKPRCSTTSVALEVKLIAVINYRMISNTQKSVCLLGQTK